MQANRSHGNFFLLPVSLKSIDWISTLFYVHCTWIVYVTGQI